MATDERMESDLRALASRRWRVAIALTGTMMGSYFGFLLLVAYAKPVAGALVAPGLSWGILLGALVIACAWAVTGTYVWWANRHYDEELARIKKGAPDVRDPDSGAGVQKAEPPALKGSG